MCYNGFMDGNDSLIKDFTRHLNKPSKKCQVLFRFKIEMQSIQATKGAFAK